MSAPAETEAKPVEPVAPVVESSSLIPAETAPPVEELKKEEAPKPTESEPAAPATATGVEETPITASQPAKEEAKTEDKPADTETTKEEIKADKPKNLWAKWFAATKVRVAKEVREVKSKSPKSPKSPKKKEGKKKEEEGEKEETKEETKEEEKKEEAPVAAEKEEVKPAYPVPAVEETSAPVPEPVKETETAPAPEAPKEETKAEEKGVEKRASDVKISRRISTRITGLFKKEPKSNNAETPAVAEEAPKLAAVAPAAPLEEPKTEIKVDPPAPVATAVA